MQLSKESKKTLIGPIVVGILFGVLVAGAIVGFDYEYGPSLYADSKYSLKLISIFHGGLAFLVVAGLTVFIFGLLPIALPHITAYFKRPRK